MSSVLSGGSPVLVLASPNSRPMLDPCLDLKSKDAEKLWHDERARPFTPPPIELGPDDRSDCSSPPLIVQDLAPVVVTQSKTWKSGDTKEKEEFGRMSTLLRHLVPASPFIPQNYPAWVEHRASMSAMKVADTKRDIALRESKSYTAARVVLRPLDGKSFTDNRSAVLAHETIWAEWFIPTKERPAAPWPDRSELQYEGDDRAKSAVGRFLPLPRKPGNETVSWKTREKLHPYQPLDHVGMFDVDGTPDSGTRQAVDALQLKPDNFRRDEDCLGRELMVALEFS